MITNLWS